MNTENGSKKLSGYRKCPFEQEDLKKKKMHSVSRANISGVSLSKFENIPLQQPDGIGQNYVRAFTTKTAVRSNQSLSNGICNILTSNQQKNTKNKITEKCLSNSL